MAVSKKLKLLETRHEHELDKHVLTRCKGKKNADAPSNLPPAFKAIALPWQSITGEPLEPPFVPEAACFQGEKQLN